jgi:hypothetical protein
MTFLYLKKNQLKSGLAFIIIHTTGLTGKLLFMKISTPFKLFKNPLKTCFNTFYKIGIRYFFLATILIFQSMLASAQSGPTKLSTVKDPADASVNPPPSHVLYEKSKASPPTKAPANKSSNMAEMVEEEGCDLTNYASAILVGAGDFPYTSPATGITISAVSNTPTLVNTTYNCGGNAFMTADTAWWMSTTEHLITLTFSEQVTNFSVVINGTNNNEIFTFNAGTGTVSLSNYCTAGFSVIGAGNQIQSISSSTVGTLITINNPVGSTVYTIMHNGVGSGSRISLLDCVGEGGVYVDPVSNIEACSGEAIPEVEFSGSPNTMFNWTNNNTAIGLAASGSGNIPGFVAATVTTQQVATITVTPSTRSPPSFLIRRMGLAPVAGRTGAFPLVQLACRMALTASLTRAMAARKM